MLNVPGAWERGPRPTYSGPLGLPFEPRLAQWEPELNRRERTEGPREGMGWGSLREGTGGPTQLLSVCASVSTQ